MSIWNNTTIKNQIKEIIQLKAEDTGAIIVLESTFDKDQMDKLGKVLTVYYPGKKFVLIRDAKEVIKIGYSDSDTQAKDHQGTHSED